MNANSEWGGEDGWLAAVVAEVMQTREKVQKLWNEKKMNAIRGRRTGGEEKKTAKYSGIALKMR